MRRINHDDAALILPDDPTVRDYLKKWHAERKARGQFSADNDESRLRVHVLPALGRIKLRELKPKDVRDLVLKLAAGCGPGKRHLAPRTVRQIYGTLRVMLNDAVGDEVIPANPAKLKRGQLPRIRDKDPFWRSRAVYTHEEVVRLISDPIIPEDRRVLNALMALTNLDRLHGERLRWT